MKQHIDATATARTFHLGEALSLFATQGWTGGILVRTRSGELVELLVSGGHLVDFNLDRLTELVNDSDAVYAMTTLPAFDLGGRELLRVDMALLDAFSQAA